MKDLREYVLTEISKKWHFETNTPINDIPIAICEKDTDLKSIYIPFEILDYNDFDNLENHLSQYETVYLIDKKKNLQIVDFDNFEFQNQLNITLVDSNISWIINVSVMFTGIGIAVSFAGKDMINLAHQIFADKAKWINKW